MATRKNNNKYQQLEPRQHVLYRPNLYIGPIEEDEYPMWIYDFIKKEMKKKNVKYTPGLFKIFDEILVNAIDHAVRLKKEKTKNPDVTLMKTIKISINKESGEIGVWNDGDGIEVEKHSEHNKYIPELIFGNLLTSSNYDDNEEKVIGGQNGIGAKACNIFSTRFELNTRDSYRKKSYSQVWTNNMEDKTQPIIKTSSQKPFTEIKFMPDYARFKLKGLTSDMYALFARRCYDVCAVTDSDINVYLNGEKLDFKNFEKYVDLYIGTKSEQPRTYEIVNDRCEVIVTHNDNGVFEHVSFVNGVSTLRGGRHVDHIVNNITSKLAELIKKRKKIEVKPGQIKNHLFIFIKSTIVNPTFDSQTKETLTTPVSKFGTKIEISDKFVDKLYKSGIVDKAIATSEVSDTKNMKKTDGRKQSTIRGLVKLDDANFAGTAKSKECTLILTEGDSAKSTAIAGLSVVGRDKFGVFPLRGKLLNVKDAQTKKIIENEEISNLKKIIGLEANKSYANVSDLRYGRIMVMTDQDVDGSHIKGLLFNLFETLWPSLITQNGFMMSLLTPIVKARYKTNVTEFYNLNDFEKWKQNTPESKSYSIKYYKGLGTSTEEEAKEYFRSLKTVTYDWNTESKNDLDLAFNKKRSDDRKEWLENYNKNMVLDYSKKIVTYSGFVHNDLIHFSKSDNERSIPNICDGLKESQRKIMFGCQKKNFDREIKVAQLSGYISEISAYHHGEASLQGTIIGLAHDFVGSNNINLLEPIGQFGTRIQGGKDAASPRYIYTRPSKVMELIFRPEDKPVLDYLDDDGFQIQPEFYIPILPMIVINGALGIGTGFSTNIPCYNPKDIISIINNKLDGNDVVEPKPWYRGFKGKIDEISEGKYVSKGMYEKVGQNKLRITELPIGMWTEDFKEIIESLLDTKDSPLKSYESHYDSQKVDFLLIFNDGSTRDKFLEDDGKLIEKELKLVSTKGLSLSNMYLFNKDGQIKKYHSIIDIIEEFMKVRFEYYEKRKDFMMKKMNNDLLYINAKVSFINEILSGTLVINNKPKKSIEEVLLMKKYPKLENEYDYLLRMPLYSLTQEKKLELEDEMVRLKTKLEQLQRLQIKDMWKSELTDLGKKIESS